MDHHHNNSDLFQLLATSGAAAYYPPAAMFMMDHHHQLSSPDDNDNLSAIEIIQPSHHHHQQQQDRALAALRNHKEAEKRRRERINSHLARLRTLLPCNSKTDKASLLAKVVQRVKELKQQTSQIINEFETLPSETDEITVLADAAAHGGLIFKASLCCEDRSDLIPDLIEILKSLHLKTLRAEMATLGGRTRNVLVVAADKEHNSIESIHFLQNSLKSLLERSGGSSDRSKRRRAMDRTFTPTSS
ncbi:hypothetical protein PIB30_021161 [Stylosanthes scabra]|uniref:BHLH domain-containing protein n=1 Tax=Stylosanthes scabra TaxID=79078 RepID=A0ABU6S916_9FABA|nr:hypothetical protein [Stylosanthes scabra]